MAGNQRQKASERFPDMFTEVTVMRRDCNWTAGPVRAGGPMLWKLRRWLCRIFRLNQSELS